MKIQNEMADTFITDNGGIRMKKADMQMFGEALRRQFPEGLVIPLPDYRLADLMDLMDDLDNEHEFMRDDGTFDGLLEARNEHIVTDGTLKAELRIPTEYYGRIYPDEESYPLDGREADARRLEASLQRYKEKERVEMEKHNARVISNEEFEETLPEVKATDDTREAFQLYSMLIRDYSMERGPKFEMHLHNVCERICSKLSEEDFRLLMQLDAELTDEAGKYFNATNAFHRKNNKDV